jgi:hypothetical protein
MFFGQDYSNIPLSDLPGTKIISINRSDQPEYPPQHVQVAVILGYLRKCHRLEIGK